MVHKKTSLFVKLGPLYYQGRYELQARLGRNPDELKKVVGEGIIILNGKRVKAELHWYEDSETGELFGMRVQRYINDD